MIRLATEQDISTILLYLNFPLESLREYVKRNEVIIFIQEERIDGVLIYSKQKKKIVSLISEEPYIEENLITYCKGKMSLI